VYLDGQLLLDGWAGPGETELRAARVLSGGSHSLEVEYEERGGDASVELRWEPVGTADLSLSLSAAPEPVSAGSRLTYSLSVSNGGPQAAPDIQVVDTLPEGATFDSAAVSQGSGCSAAGRVVTCLLGTLADDGSATATIVVIPGPLSSGTTATLVNQANVASTGAGDPSLADNGETVESTAKGLIRRGVRGSGDSLTAGDEPASEAAEAEPTASPTPPRAATPTPTRTPAATPRATPSTEPGPSRPGRR
jgi:uncharacterized repeat protein (TIGR01451 family)